jgi:catechol 2,3-dioxygenase-like lactoylglutathione lyase family enzyme
MPVASKAYVEHVAVRVKDIDWHLHFFREVLGMTLRQETGGADGKPRQVWTLGGMQFIADPDFAGPEGRLGHVGIMAEDQEAVLAAAKAWGVKELPQGRHFLALPDGLVIEILPASSGAVAAALAVDPRA